MARNLFGLFDLITTAPAARTEKTILNSILINSFSAVCVRSVVKKTIQGAA